LSYYLSNSEIARSPILQLKRRKCYRRRTSDRPAPQVPASPARNRQPRSTAISLARLPCPPRPRPLQQPPPPPFSLFFNSGESASPPLTVNCPRPPSALLLSHDPSSPSTSELPRRRLPSAAPPPRPRHRRRARWIPPPIPPRLPSPPVLSPGARSAPAMRYYFCNGTSFYIQLTIVTI
jgi:hypothetical protein